MARRRGDRPIIQQLECIFVSTKQPDRRGAHVLGLLHFYSKRFRECDVERPEEKTKRSSHGVGSTFRGFEKAEKRGAVAIGQISWDFWYTRV
jgi:hypothetical protein